MEKQIEGKEKIKDVKLDEKTWKQLSIYKIKGGFKNMALVIKELLKK